MKDFDRKILSLAKKVPKGRVTTYGEIGRALGIRGFRAIGQALKRNSKPVIIPCHRVVRSDGGVGGYLGKRKVNEKIRLLRKEGIEVTKEGIDLKRYFFRLCP